MSPFFADGYTVSTEYSEKEVYSAPTKVNSSCFELDKWSIITRLMYEEFDVLGAP